MKYLALAILLTPVSVLTVAAQTTLQPPPVLVQPGTLQPPGQLGGTPPPLGGGTLPAPEGFVLQPEGGGIAPPAPPQPPAPNVDPQLEAKLLELDAYERQEMGVQPVTELHPGAPHGPTPSSIPGGQLITTRELIPLVQSGQPFLMFDVLGSGQSLPGAIPMVPASQPGTFTDNVQAQLGPYLQQVTGGNPDVPMVFYCLSTQCWLSYNAALRAINLGYRQVKWYRGGIEAWGYAGLPLTGGGQVLQ